MLYITFADIDERQGGEEKEHIIVDSFEAYYTHDDLSIVAERSPQPTFQLSEYGNYSDNAFSADSPSPQQLSRSHAQGPGKVFFPCGFKIKDHRDWGAGHNFLFSGICSWFFCHR